VDAPTLQGFLVKHVALQDDIFFVMVVTLHTIDAPEI